MNIVELKSEIEVLKSENINLKKQQIEISKAKELYLGILEEFPALIWRANTEKLCDYFNTKSFSNVRIYFYIPSQT